MTASPLSYRVEAYNISHASENKIHDDSVAKKLGFTGGLVPGVEIYAYMTNPMVAKHGTAFLERGRIDARFFKPLYDGRMADVTATPTASGYDLKLTSDGVECATGTAAVDAEAPPRPDIAKWQAALPPDLDQRPPADEASLAKGKALGIKPQRLTTAQTGDYLRDIRETLPLYATEGIAHPGLLLRMMNLALRENVVLAPWIHTGSKVQNFSLARVGDEISVRAWVTDNYERKGHRLVDLDGLIIANGDRVVARVIHTAVYKLRHLAAA